MHSYLRNALPLDDILVCYHDDPDACNCRKPQPGLLLEAARRHHLQLASSFMVGDRWRDIDAGLNAGVRTVLIDIDYREREPSQPPAARVASLREAAEWIIRQID
jgi:D-glycero-D-manno-heptose 1,7-bisphosphate phosphatase